jgi:hypothetical protein
MREEIGTIACGEFPPGGGGGALKAYDRRHVLIYLL